MLSASKNRVQDENAAVLRSAAKNGLSRGEPATVDKSALRPSRTPGTQRKALGNISNVLPSAGAQKLSLSHETGKKVSGPAKPSIDRKIASPVKEHQSFSAQEEEFDIVSCF